ncbi:hypothetical protein [Pararhodobacter sp.]|uniref:hypothetical protein n=1 Tax=Pararhodobacter sp. TaxID=2127056 RepID=UPI002FDF5CE8
MARQLRIPSGIVHKFDAEKAEAVVIFDLNALKASKGFAKLKKSAPAMTDEQLLRLIIGHLAEGVE